MSTANSQTPFLLPSTKAYLIPTSGMQSSEKETMVGKDATVGIIDLPTLNQSKGNETYIYELILRFYWGVNEVLKLA